MARAAAYQGKMHGRKSVQGLAMARREFGELTVGELTRFDCIYVAIPTDVSTIHCSLSQHYNFTFQPWSLGIFSCVTLWGQALLGFSGHVHFKTVLYNS